MTDEPSRPCSGDPTMSKGQGVFSAVRSRCQSVIRKSHPLLHVSLTSLLAANKPLRERLRALVPESERTSLIGLPEVASPRTKHYSLVGTAFDYLFRFEVARRNKSAFSQKWIAEAGLNLAKRDLSRAPLSQLRWPPDTSAHELVEQFERAYSEALKGYARYVALQAPAPEDLSEAASHALRLAKLDPIFRAGYVDPSPESADPLDVEDLVALLRAAPFDRSLAPCLGPRVWLNPTFGRFSLALHGADADLIAGDVLIDLKTTTNPVVAKHLPQLVGYAILAEAHRAAEAPEFPEIEYIGLYFSRQATLVVLPLEPVRANADYPGACRALLGHSEESPMMPDDVLSGRAATTREVYFTALRLTQKTDNRRVKEERVRRTSRPRAKTSARKGP